MTREELMLAVVEAAERMPLYIHTAGWETAWHQMMQAIADLRAFDVSALDAHRPEPEGEMVDVYGAIRVDPKGYVGGRVFRQEKDARRMSREGGSTENGPIVGVFFTARVPLPRIPEIRATVEGASSDGPISQDEMITLFGEEMPIEAVQLVLDAPPKMTVAEVRSKLRELAAKRAATVAPVEAGE